MACQMRFSALHTLKSNLPSPQSFRSLSILCVMLQTCFLECALLLTILVPHCELCAV